MTGLLNAHLLRILLCAILAAAAGPAFAHHKPGHAGGPPGGNNDAVYNRTPTHAISVSPDAVTLRLDDTIIRVVNDWFRANPQVYSSYSALPPGIARKLERGKPLPPGIAKNFLPTGLVSILPPVPQGYGRFIVGDDLVLIELSSGLIADVANILF